MTGQRATALFALKGAQARAAEPEGNVWLRASAGTGKTQVLIARVLRLLLRPGVRPEHILCLTFTKAGATVMANRISAMLTRWVRLGDAPLAADLKAIGAPIDPASQRRARELFAAILDAPGGGLQIMTIHSFCQSLLASFPVEAGLRPGFRAMDERQQAELEYEVLAALVAEHGAGPLGETICHLAETLGERGATRFLQRCARAPAALRSLGGTAVQRQSSIFVLAGVPEVADVDRWLAERCEDERIDRDALSEAARMLAAWGKRQSAADSARILGWLAASAEERAQGLDALHRCWSKTDGTAQASKGHSPADPAYPELAGRLHGWAEALLGDAARIRWAERYAAAIEAGLAYGEAYDKAKRRRGAMDFDDLIERTARLLADPGMGAWIRYKLDTRIDHILVDEAQDTNAAQWAIVGALTEEFFAGAGARGERLRTLFTVGDVKQAIFGFQGTSPYFYEEAQRHFVRLTEDGDDPLAELSLAHSFRSTAPILRFVDTLLAGDGAEALGANAAFEPHRPVRPDIGEVLLLPPVMVAPDDSEEEEDSGDEPESAVPAAQRLLADRIAMQLRRWLDDPEYRLASGQRLAPGDVMILLRKRGALAAEIVARLHRHGVPVAGVDRLRLSAPLCVRDVMAALRFAIQPADELNLASLLVSPLIGWSHDELHARGYRPPGARLWRHLREHHGDAAGMAALHDLLARADFVGPHRMIEDVLGGRLDGRRRLAERLGGEVDDPLGELVNAALQFEASGGASLQAFVHWFDRDDVEVKREASGAGGAVRVMTVHAAKGLEAPLVIVADTTVDPLKTPDRAFDQPLGEYRLPLLPITGAAASGLLAEAVAQHRQRELQEHRRLLYVALTRAQERLVLAGALGGKQKAPPAESWYPLLERAMASLPTTLHDDPLWGPVLAHRGQSVPPSAALPAAAAVAPMAAPDWLRRPPPPEAQPPRPLAPSAAPFDDSGEAPAEPARAAAARRGQLLHQLFERLPALPTAQRRQSAAGWIVRQAPDYAHEAADRLIDTALAVLDRPEWQALFAPEALAEAPIAALVGQQLVTGRVDRLLLRPDRIDLIDFKTGLRVPADAQAVPIGHLRQMAWYATALAVIYRDRPVHAGLLYTHGPTLITLPQALLDQHRPG